MDLQEARAWLQSSAAQRYLQAIDDDAEEAITAANRLAGQMGGYPSSASAGLRRMATDLRSAQGAFNLEVNRITFEQARDGRAVLRAYRGYIAALVRCEAETGRLNAFVEADFAAVVAAVIAMGVAYQRTLRRDLETALSDLERWQSELTRAQRSLSESEAQRGINLALSGIALLISLTPQGRIATVVISVGGMAVQTALDVYLGTPPDALGVSNTALGNLSGLPNAIRPNLVRNSVGRMTTGVTALVGLHFDTNEVDDARRRVARVATEMRRAQRSLERTFDRLSRWGVDLDLANRMLEGATTRARAAARAVETSERDHRNLMRALEDID
jgi:hypothetical protein